MRYLILSDIHANLEALEQTLALISGQYDRALCLGDLVGYGPDPNAVIERTRALTQVIIRGNHDKACAGLTDAKEFNQLARFATAWTRQQLTPEHLEFLQALPLGPVALDGFEIVHGSPTDEDQYILGPTEALPALRSLTVQTMFFGHTHYQGGFMVTPQGRFQSLRWTTVADGQPITLPIEEGGRYLINPGSVGQPRDGDSRAAFAILDEGERLVEYYRTPYNLPKTQEKMVAAGLPDPLVRRLELGR